MTEPPMKPVPCQSKADKTLVAAAWAALSAMLSVTLTRKPVSTPKPAPAVGTAWTFTTEIHWSGDGTVAAVTASFSGQPGPLYGCAYDFLKHQA